MVCLTECWINTHDTFELNGYEQFVFPRKKGRGGGMVVFYKSSLIKNVKLVENFFDCIIWLQINPLSANCKSIYIASCYFPPENSVFYNRNDVDLFQILEDTTCKYMKENSTYVIGDLNSRCGIRDDFILNDVLSADTNDSLQNVIHYNSDSGSETRNSADKTVNQFGRKLIDYCKTTGMRIVNGKHKDDPFGSVTFFSTLGISLIDYLLTDVNNIVNIKTFSSGVFNPFSDHSPICCTIPFNLRDTCHMSDDMQYIRCRSKSVKWVEENVDVVSDSLLENSEHLSACVNSSCESLNDVNTCVNDFGTLLNDIVLPHCNVKTGSGICVDNQNRKKQDINTDKPWFNENCKKKYREYKDALYNFNVCKSIENHDNLIRLKSAYKKLSNRLKRQYKRTGGNMMNFLRKNNPKAFYRHFAKKQPKRNGANITIDQFHEYFKNLVTCDSNIPTSDPPDISSCNETVFDELDAEISVDEIFNAIKKLNTGKSCSEDGLLNEIFIKCKDILVPYLHKLFNNVLNSGYFPEAWSSGCIIPVFKKGDINDPNNYRGITIVSCLGKLFTSVLCNRILDWNSKNDVITDAQFGFKPGFGTIDAIFVLQSLISRTLKRKKRLYCCFIDYR